MSKRDYTVKNLFKLSNFINLHVEQHQLNMMYCRSTDGREVYFIDYDNCGDCGSSLGWSPFVPDLPAKDWMFSFDDDNDVKCLFFSSYQKMYYPAIAPYLDHYTKAFGYNQSSDKPSVVRRLREVADELRESVS